MSTKTGGQRAVAPPTGGFCEEELCACGRISRATGEGFAFGCLVPSRRFSTVSEWRFACPMLTIRTCLGDLLLHTVLCANAHEWMKIVDAGIADIKVGSEGFILCTGAEVWKDSLR